MGSSGLQEPLQVWPLLLQVWPCWLLAAHDSLYWLSCHCHTHCSYKVWRQYVSHEGAAEHTTSAAPQTRQQDPCAPKRRPKPAPAGDGARGGAPEGAAITHPAFVAGQTGAHPQKHRLQGKEKLHLPFRYTKRHTHKTHPAPRGMQLRRTASSRGGARRSGARGRSRQARVATSTARALAPTWPPSGAASGDQNAAAFAIWRGQRLS